MRARRWWALGAAVVLGWSAALATADEDGTPARRPVVRPNERPGIIDKLLDLGSDTTDKKTDKKADKKDSVKKNEKSAGDKTKSNISPAAAELARHEAALMRRIEVCDKLAEIAIANNDKELEQLAQELNARACALYKQRVAKLQAPPEDRDLDEQILDKKLGIDAAPEEPKPAVTSNTRRNREEPSQAATKEDDR
jgi:hypothetical protein